MRRRPVLFRPPARQAAVAAFAAAAIWLVLAMSPQAALKAAPAGGTCQRDAVVVLSAVRQARAELSEAASGSDKQRCAAWRHQVTALRKASAFYKRCQSGPERDRNVANANAGAAQYAEAVKTRCSGRQGDHQ